jgi:hypothetical protein
MTANHLQLEQPILVTENKVMHTEQQILNRIELGLERMETKFIC